VRTQSRCQRTTSSVAASRDNRRVRTDLTDTELDELADLLGATPEPLTPLDVLMLEGYLCGTLVQPRVVGLDEWLPPVFDFEGRALPDSTDAVWRARVTALIQRRRDALNAGISEDGFFDPVIVDVDQLPPASEYDAVQSPISRALMPWAAGFQWAQECFADLEDTTDEAIGAAVSRIYQHLPPQNDEEKALVATIEREQPLKDLDAGIEDLVNAARRPRSAATTPALAAAARSTRPVTASESPTPLRPAPRNRGLRP
jgi:uncharacterized protein